VNGLPAPILLAGFPLSIRDNSPAVRRNISVRPPHYVKSEGQ